MHSSGRGAERGACRKQDGVLHDSKLHKKMMDCAAISQAIPLKMLTEIETG